jgi:hypothetical protein
MESFWDWLKEHFWEVFFGSLLVLALVVVAVGVQEGIKKKQWFMRECMKDKKEYECYVMWESTQDRTVAVPVVVPVYSGR